MNIKDKVKNIRAQSTADNAMKEVLESIADSIEAIEKQIVEIKKSQSKPKKEVKKESE